MKIKKKTKTKNSKSREQHSSIPELFVLIVQFLFRAALGWDLLMKDGHSPLLFM